MMRMIVFSAFLAAVFLAGYGIQTARAGGSAEEHAEIVHDVQTQIKAQGIKSGIIGPGDEEKKQKIISQQNKNNDNDNVKKVYAGPKGPDWLDEPERPQRLFNNVNR